MKRIIVALLAIALTSSGLFAQAQQKEVLPYDALIRSAKIYLGQPGEKDYEHVIELLQTAIDNYPDPLEAHFYMGIIAAERSEFATMMEHFRKFEAICSKERTDADKKIAKRCSKDDMPKQIQNNKDAEFRRSFDDGVKQLRSADSVSTAMATATDDSTKAKQADIINQLLTKSQGLFNECIIIDDTIAGVWTNMALIERRRGDVDKALEYYQRSYALNPLDAMMVYDMAGVYYDKKDFVNSARYYGEFGELDKNNAEVAFTNQALAYQMMGDMANLEATLDKILAVNPNNADIRYQRGVFHIRNASSPAIRDSAAKIDSLLELKPSDAGLKAAKEGIIKERNAMNEKAFADFKLAAEASGKDPLYWYWYGTSAQFLDKQDEAKTAYEKCVETDPEYKECWCELMKIYARKGMKAESEKAAAKCPSDKPGN